MINKMRTSFLAAPYALWVLICTILPLFYILGYAVTSSSGSFTLENLTAIADPVHLKSLWLSIKVAFMTTVICLVLAYPVALILHNLKITNKDIADYLDGLPPEKMHCSVMGREALDAAAANYRGESYESAHADSPLVCKCFGVDEAHIVRAVRENHLTSVQDVTNYTKAGGACGPCCRRRRGLKTAGCCPRHRPRASA